MAQIENKIPAFPVLEPLSKATATALAPMELLDTDFLEIDIAASEARMIKTGKHAGESTGDDMMHFEVQAVCLKRLGRFTRMKCIITTPVGTRRQRGSYASQSESSLDTVNGSWRAPTIRH